jgi:hypothetical protein
MKNIILLLIVNCSLLIANCYADPYIIKLEAKKEIIIEGRSYYVSRVIDNRADRSRKIGEFGKKDLELENVLEESFLNYISTVFPQNNNAKTPVTLTINSIECIAESKTISYKVKVNLEIELNSPAFNGITYTIRVNNTVDRVMPNGKTFSNLIQDDLNDCMKDIKQYIK